MNVLVLVLASGVIGCGGKDSYVELTDDTIAFNEKLLALLEGVTDGSIDGGEAGEILDELEDAHADLRSRLKALPTPTVEEAQEMRTAVADSAKRMPAVVAKAVGSGKFTPELSKRISGIAR
jgi:hypothetical protein